MTQELPNNEPGWAEQLPAYTLSQIGYRRTGHWSSKHDKWHFEKFEYGNVLPPTSQKTPLPLVHVPSPKRFKRGPSLELFCRVWEMSWSIIWFQNYFCWRQIDALYCPRVRAPILPSFESVGTTISSQIIVYRCRLWEVPFPFSVFWKLVSIFSTFSWRQQCNTAQHLDFYKGASLLGINLKIHSNTKESWVRVDVHILFLLSLPGVHEGGVEGCRGNL